MDNTKEDLQLSLFLSQHDDSKPFFGFEEFDIAADKRVTLDDLMDRWTAPKGFFAKCCIPMGNILPVVGLVYSFDEGQMYHCMPLPLLSRLLTTPEGHPDYAKKFADSFACFAQNQGLEGFIIPQEGVNRAEKLWPHLLRERSLPRLAPVNNEIHELNIALKQLTREEIWQDRDFIINLLLYKAGVQNELIFYLLDEHTEILKNSMHKRLREWRKSVSNIIEQRIKK